MSFFDAFHEARDPWVSPSSQPRAWGFGVPSSSYGLRAMEERRQERIKDADAWVLAACTLAQPVTLLLAMLYLREKLGKRGALGKVAATAVAFPLQALSTTTVAVLRERTHA